MLASGHRDPQYLALGTSAAQWESDIHVGLQNCVSLCRMEGGVSPRGYWGYSSREECGDCQYGQKNPPWVLPSPPPPTPAIIRQAIKCLIISTGFAQVSVASTEPWYLWSCTYWRANWVFTRQRWKSSSFWQIICYSSENAKGNTLQLIFNYPSLAPEEHKARCGI